MNESRPLVLLVADDEPVLATGLQRLFERRGYEVIVALSGKGAIDVLGRHQVDGLLLDFRIPDLRGDVLYAAAIAIQPHLRGRTVFLTGDISEGAAESLDGEGCPVVLKPFDIPELERIVAEVMRDRYGAADGGAGASAEGE